MVSAAVSVQLLGPPRLLVNGHAVVVPSRKALGLLALLASQPGVSVARARLVALLWEESGEREGRNSLSVVLSRLRQLAPTLPIVAEGDALCWRPTAAIRVDTDAYLAGTGAAADLASLEAAASLWRGPFLEDIAVHDSVAFDDWVEVERAAWQGRHLATLGRIVSGREAEGAWQRALEAARRALALDPLQEVMHRAIMSIHARAGDRAAALAQYRACQEILAQELGAGPDAETEALHHQISRGQVASRPPARSLVPPIQLPPPVLRLVGRDEELATVRHLLAEREEGGRLIVVQGEVGIGKSRLVEEILRTMGQAAGAGWGVLLGHCYATERGLPYQPIVDALTAALPGIHLPALGLADVWLDEVARLLPDLAGDRAARPAAEEIDPAQRQRRLFEGVSRLLSALGARLLLVLEDLHWADEGTLHLLSFVLHHEVNRSVTVLATVRTEDVEAPLAACLRGLEREGRLATVRLERLDAEATQALLREMVADPMALLGERLFSETEGNPLFAVETLRSLLEQGTLGKRTRLMADLILPDSVQSVIQARLARLDDAARDLLMAAAIFRRGATFDQLGAVSGLEEGAALAALEGLLQARLLREVIDRTGHAGGEEAYIFGHDKFRQVVYDDLSAARRRVLHRRAFAHLEATGGLAAELAHHATMGHLWEQGLARGEQAIAEALRVFGYAAATRLYEQALACLAHLPDSETRQRREIGLRLEMAKVGFYVQPGALTDWLAPAAAAAAGLDDAPLLTRVRLAQAGALYIQGRFDIALPLLEELARSPVIAASDEARARLYDILGRLLVLRGELRRARAVLQEALPLMVGRGTPMEVLVSTNMAAAAAAYMGDFDTALATAEAMRDRADAMHDPSPRAVSRAFLEIIALTRGEWALAEAHGREAIALARAGGNSIYEYVGHVFLGPALARQGDIAGGLAVARQALALAEQAQIKVLLPRLHGWLGEIYLLAGDIEEGLRVALRGHQIARDHGWTLEGALCQTTLAQVYAARGDWPAADEAIAASLAVLAALEARPDLARAELARARLASARGEQAAVGLPGAAKAMRRKQRVESG